MNDTAFHHDHAVSHGRSRQKENILKLAFSATWHCLIGCGLGEILGMIIGTWQEMSNSNTMILALSLGALMGLLFGVVPLIRAGFSLKRAARMVIIAEGLSILVMESVEVLVQVLTPGVMDAHLTDRLFWMGMIGGLVAGFIAAFPVNYLLIKRGVRHQH